MKYSQVSVTCPRDELQRIEDLLIFRGFDSFEVTDFADLEDAVGQVFYDYIDDELLKSKDEDPVIKICFDADSADRLEELKKLLAKENIAFSLSENDSADWEDEWKKFFFPFPVGEKLYVKPSWLEAGEDSAGRRILEIDPASAFGSGTHATTRLCLEEAERLIMGGEKVLDMGCGSGILGIGALALGAGSVTAVDIDPNAVRVASENFSVNSCDPLSYRALCGDALGDPAFARSLGGDYDLILANIVAGVIEAMSPLFYSLVKPGGTLVSSGIIEEKTAEVRDALLSAGFAVVSEKSFDGWSEITARREG
ncbi:MAG: 50S ribosomal protein L11 methyltransferase [Clostridia bacterium]|nr:50S ribosomal protein L11 methyltransferase [Clostridia bacterium]